jgi:hypothetical protein
MPTRARPDNRSAQRARTRRRKFCASTGILCIPTHRVLSFRPGGAALPQRKTTALGVLIRPTGPDMKWRSATRRVVDETASRRKEMMSKIASRQSRIGGESVNT